MDIKNYVSHFTIIVSCLYDVNDSIESERTKIFDLTFRVELLLGGAYFMEFSSQSDEWKRHHVKNLIFLPFILKKEKEIMYERFECWKN